jgi:glycosyltransferase involved in cell wall biosynthesis
MVLHLLFVWSYWQYPEVALELLRKIRGKGHKISVFIGDVEGDFDPKNFDDDINFYFASKWNGLSTVTGTPYPVFRNIKSCFKILHPDVVHINSHLFLSNYQAARAASSLGLPVVVTVHGVMVRRGLILDTLQRVYLRTVASSLFDIAAAVICLTENDAAAIAKLVKSDSKISIIPNGVDIDFFKPSADKVENLIAWVGRLVPEKGLVYLLKAMPEVVSKIPAARLVLVGDGILSEELLGLVHVLGLRDNVEFLGTVGRVKVVEILSRASVFAFPSLREGLPFSVLEAMACGVPVIGSNIPGVNDLVDNGVSGLLVQPRESEALAKAIISLLKDDKRRRIMSEAARSKIVKDYSWSNIIKKIDDVYHAVV